MKQAIEKILEEAKEGLTSQKKEELTVRLVKELFISARVEESAIERKERELLGGIVQDQKSKAFAMTFADRCFRSKNDRAVMRQFTALLDLYGIPKTLSMWQKIAFTFARKVGPFFPSFFIPFIKDIVRLASEKVIILSEKEVLAQHLQKRKKEGIEINLNHLGEAILGEDEALRRLNRYIEELKREDVGCISVKISTLYSQIDPIAREETLSILADRLRLLYRAAMQHGFKFVNLDMEEFRHLDLTVEVFLKVMSEEEFQYATFGVALQSYLPDSFEMQKKITAFAEERVRNGGAPLKIRLVKGANLAMEKVDASLKNFPQAPYLTKEETDANFLRMFEFGVEHAQSVYMGIGSHNLFDVAYAMLSRAEKGLYKEVGFEMLEGMAPSLTRIIHEATGSMLLYCPVASKKDFHTAIAYLIRRFDENASDENFLHSFFNMEVNSVAFETERKKFFKALSKVTSVESASRRGKPRINPLKFYNEPDVDWVLKPSLELLNGVYQDWSIKKGGHIPVEIGGEEIFGFHQKMFGYDPSDSESVRYTYTMADQDLAFTAVESAKKAFDRFSQTEIEQRADLLTRAADEIRKKRFELIGVMMADGGKLPSEADGEVSEAIDFCIYYRNQALGLFSSDDLTWEAKGVVAVLPPWNFPCSIPAGCIAAALACGNAVIFKPAPQTVWVGYELVKCFWDAGVPKEVLQFITGDDEEVGTTIVKHPDTALACLTGSNETAKRLFELNPNLQIIAETGGKNSMIVTAMSDRDLAISDIIRSAFSHSGQKCSALSLLVLENEVYKDPSFMRQLHDAAKSLAVGSVFDPRTKIGPLIGEAQGKLLRGLTTLDEGEEWLLKPKMDSKNNHLWSPGIKMGVKEGSFTHQTELFGPVLAICRAKNLEHAILIANGTPYGLTAGLHSLDEKEQKIWFQKIKAGNCYVNRGMTGALVERQPFGGVKESSFGRGHKAGGPNYLTQFMKARQIDPPKEVESARPTLKPLMHFVLEHQLSKKEKYIFERSVENYEYHWKHFFSQKHDPQKLIGQDNFLIYRPHRLIVCRMEREDSPVDLYRVIAACFITGTPLELSLPKEVYTILPNQAALKGCTLHVEDQAEFLERFGKGFKQRLRLLSDANHSLKMIASKTLAVIVDDPVLMNGRFELLHYLKEVSLSHDYHRYGNLGVRDKEERGDESGLLDGRNRRAQ